MASTPQPPPSPPQLPLDLILLISSYTALPTLSKLSRTCSILHTHLSPRLRKLFVLSKAAPYLCNRDLPNLVLTCRTLHTHLTPALNRVFVAEATRFIYYTKRCRLRRTCYTPVYRHRDLRFPGWGPSGPATSDRDPNSSYRGPGLLYYAAKNGFTEEVRLLLDLGVDAHWGDMGFGTPLSRAIAGGYVEIVEMLLEGGAWLPRIEARDNASERAEEIKALLVMFGGVVGDGGAVVMEEAVFSSAGSWDS